MVTAVPARDPLNQLLITLLHEHRERHAEWLSSRWVPADAWAAALVLIQGGLLEHAGTLVRLTEKGMVEAQRVDALAAQADDTPKLYRVNGQVEFMVCARGPIEALVLADRLVQSNSERPVWREPVRVTWLHDLADDWSTKVPYSDLDVADRTCQAWLTP